MTARRRACPHGDRLCPCQDGDRTLCNHESWDAAAMAAWRHAHQRCVDRLRSIEKGLNESTFATSELDAIAEALASVDHMAWPGHEVADD